jgi:dienelactone hydrolase
MRVPVVMPKERLASTQPCDDVAVFAQAAQRSQLHRPPKGQGHSSRISCQVPPRVSRLILGATLSFGLAFACSSLGAEPTESSIERITRGSVGFVVSVPVECKKTACGLIVDVHGGMMNADDQDRETQIRRLGNHARNFGAAVPFIVVQPERLREGLTWLREDLDPILQFVDEVTDRFGLRPDYRFFGGFSQGGMMAAWLICDRRSDRFAAFSVVAGGSRELLECLDHGRAPTAPILVIHGRADRIVPFADTDSLRRKLAEQQSDDWDVTFSIHDHRGGFAGGHCVPGGLGRFGCGGNAAGEEIIAFYAMKAVNHPSGARHGRGASATRAR